MKTSVCICTCKRPALLERLLASLRDVDLGGLTPDDVKVVVVDNSPTGEARAVCERVARTLPIELHFAEEERRGIPFARNRAVREALSLGSEWIAFIDDDDLPQSDWLLQLLQKQEESRADVVCGVWRWNVPANGSSWARSTPLFRSLPLDQRSRGIPPWMATCNVLISRETIETLAAEGPVFSPEFGFLGCDDTDMFIRASKAGARIEVAEKSIINRYWEEFRLTLRGILRHSFRQGNTIVHIAKKHDAPAGLRRTKTKAIKRLTLGLLLLPTSVFSKRRMARQLYKIGRGLGMLYAFRGGQFDYYR